MFADRAARQFAVLTFGVVLCCGAGARDAKAQAAPDYAALIAAPDRSDADREAHKRRDPLPLLNIAGPPPRTARMRPAKQTSAAIRCRCSNSPVRRPA